MSCGARTTQNLRSFVVGLSPSRRLFSSCKERNQINVPSPKLVRETQSSVIRYPAARLLTTTSVLRAAGNRGNSSTRSSGSGADRPAKKRPKMNIPQWIMWVMGSIVTVFVPFWKLKWRQFLMIEEEAGVVIHEAEHVAEVVEKTATTAAKISAGVADGQKEDSKLKEAALIVEEVSKAAAHDAHATKEFLEKVEEMKSEFDEIVEPLNKMIP